MAKKGLSCFLAAPLNETEKSYGEIIKMIGAASVKKALTKNNGEVPGDNIIMIEDKSVTGGTLDISVVDDDPAVFAPVIGKTKKSMDVKIGEKTESVDYYVGNGNDVGNPFGFGYIEKEKDANNKIKYRVNFFPKTTWADYDSSAETEGKTANYQKPTVQGTLHKLENQDYSCEARVDTLLLAVATLYKFFGKTIPEEEAARFEVTEATEGTEQTQA